MDTYLGKLWLHNKKLFLLACLFIAGCLLPSLIGFEITPFFDWKMYARPIAARTEYDTYLVRCDGNTYSKPHTWQDYSRMMVTYTLPHYDAIKTTGDTIPFYTKTSYLFLAAFRWNRHEPILNMNTAGLQQYPAWLKRYMAQQTGRQVHHIAVERVRVRYDADNHIVPLKKVSVIDE